MVESDQICQKAHLHAKTFHMGLYPRKFWPKTPPHIVDKNRLRTDRRTPQIYRPQPLRLGPKNTVNSQISYIIAHDFIDF